MYALYNCVLKKFINKKQCINIRLQSAIKGN